PFCCSFVCIRSWNRLCRSVSIEILEMDVGKREGSRGAGQPARNINISHIVVSWGYNKAQSRHSWFGIKERSAPACVSRGPELGEGMARHENDTDHAWVCPDRRKRLRNLPL